MVTGGPLSSRPASRSLLSHFEVISVDGARARRSRSAAAATICWSPPRPPASGATTSELGQPSPELRLATPTSQRRDHEAGGNWFAPARLEVPDRRSAGRDRSSVSSSSGWRRRAGSRRCRWRRRWRRRSGACRRGCSSRRCTPKPTPSTSPPPRSRVSAVTAQPLRIADRGELSARAAAGLPDEHHGVRQRRSPRCGHRPRPGRHRPARPPGRVPDRGVRQLRRDGGEPATVPARCQADRARGARPTRSPSTASAVD